MCCESGPKPRRRGLPRPRPPPQPKNTEPQPATAALPTPRPPQGQAWADKASGGAPADADVAARPGGATYSDMIAHALKKLPDEHGDFKDICKVIEQDFFEQLNWKLESDLRKTPVWKSSVRKILYSNAPSAARRPTGSFCSAHARINWGALAFSSGARRRRHGPDPAAEAEASYVLGFMPPAPQAPRPAGLGRGSHRDRRPSFGTTPSDVELAGPLYDEPEQG